MNSFSRRIASWAIFIIGFCLMLLGVALLLRSAAGSSGILTFISYLFLVVGSIFAFLAIRLNKRTIYVFGASFILMVGFFVSLAAVKLISVNTMFKSWPLISVFAGLALLPAGHRHYGAFKSRFVVPSCVFIALGLVFIVFSFDLVTFSFRQFILDWWPLFIILTGILMALFSLGVRHGQGDHGQ